MLFACSEKSEIQNKGTDSSTQVLRANDNYRTYELEKIMKESHSIQNLAVWYESDLQFFKDLHLNVRTPPYLTPKELFFLAVIQRICCIVLQIGKLIVSWNI
jgi:hypothetical protein